MAFDGHQSTFANSLFPSYQRQTSVNNGSVVLPFVAVPSASQREQNAAPYLPWSHTDHDDPYGLIKCAQSNIIIRKPGESADCEGEMDLQGLVSNILDEADSQDSYYSEGNLPTCNPIWSPKTLREELLQYFQSEAKTQHHPTFPPNYVSGETLSKAQGQPDVKEFHQQSNGLSTKQPWLLNLPNGDQDGSALRPQKPPPGLSMPNMGNTHSPQAPRRRYDNMPAERDRGSSQPVNNLPDLGNIFRPQREMNSPRCRPHHEDQSASNERYGPQDINQLVSSFQSFMAGEHGGLHGGDFPNVHRQTAGMPHEDAMFEQWKIAGPGVSAQRTPAMHTQKQLAGEFGMERKGEARRQVFQRDAFQDPQNTEYYHSPKPFTAPLHLGNQHHSNMTVHRENASLPLNSGMSQYLQHHIQPGLMQSKPRPQVQREKKRMHMSGFPGEGFSARPPANTNTRGGDKRQALSQNPNHAHLASMLSHRFDGENTQPLMPYTYAANDPRRYSNAPPNFSCRSTLPYGMDAAGDVISANESAVFNSYVGNMLACRGEITYHGMASAGTTSMGMNPGGAVVQLYFYLDECNEQWRGLERARKRTEGIITKIFYGKSAAATTNTNLPKTPPNPTRVDHLLVNQMREQARVASLLDRMESLCNTAFHVNIHTALSRHHMALCVSQARRKEESTQQRQRAHLSEDRDTLLLAVALKDLAATTRRVRTALWCALQMTLPKPTERQDHRADREAPPSPFEGYSFKYTI
ncbi:hypothetical protein VZT92_007770 [Zoarces viviparus]|uniref:Meiosis-specific coiled-coil domain-containing protein MEIOC n=1 Tax=Zoarces viviparus TaxID=48416 RepID=A0AAW1FKW9_ZOAVI